VSSIKIVGNSSGTGTFTISSPNSNTSRTLTLPDTDGELVVGGGFASGTLMLFQQTSAPTGWTKQTTHNDKALRVVSGTASSGGSVAFSTAMGTPTVDTSSMSAGAHTLTTAEMPSHNHTVYAGTSSGSNPLFGYTSGYTTNLSSTTSSTGGGGSHSHSISGSATATINVNYVDLIIASKD